MNEETERREEASEQARAIANGAAEPGPHSFIAVSIGGVELDSALKEIHRLRLEKAILSGTLIGVFVGMYLGMYLYGRA